MNFRTLQNHLPSRSESHSEAFSEGQHGSYIGRRKTILASDLPTEQLRGVGRLAQIIAKQASVLLLIYTQYTVFCRKFK